jgi:hypothetical protein
LIVLLKPTRIRLYRLGKSMQDAVFANIVKRSENAAKKEVDGPTPIDFEKMEQILYRTNEAEGFSKFSNRKKSCRCFK